MFRLPFKVYAAVITLKLNKLKQNEKKVLKFEIFYENHSPQAIQSTKE